MNLHSAAVRTRPAPPANQVTRDWTLLSDDSPPCAASDIRPATGCVLGLSALRDRHVDRDGMIPGRATFMGDATAIDFMSFATTLAMCGPARRPASAASFVALSASVETWRALLPDSRPPVEYCLATANRDTRRRSTFRGESTTRVAFAWFSVEGELWPVAIGSKAFCSPTTFACFAPTRD